jgi:hypothetical protein
VLQTECLGKSGPSLLRHEEEAAAPFLAPPEQRRTVSRAMFQQTATPCRRANYRIATLVDVWVCWNCNGREDISRVRDMGIGGLFLNTRLRRATGTPMKIDFLVQEGQIRADAVVRHAVLDRGLGLKFTALTEQDRPRFAALMRRVRH